MSCATRLRHKNYTIANVRAASRARSSDIELSSGKTEPTLGRSTMRVMVFGQSDGKQRRGYSLLSGVDEDDGGDGQV